MNATATRMAAALEESTRIQAKYHECLCTVLAIAEGSKSINSFSNIAKIIKEVIPLTKVQS